MSTPYRTDLDALRETKAALEKELDVTKERLRHVDETIKARTRLPMLDNVKVASPCNASWDEMLGDDRVRFCTSCEKNVFNLSAMPREDAERLLADKLNGELCVRFYQRADGTVMTQDCPVGVTKKRRKLAVLSAAGAGAMAIAAFGAMTRTMGKPSRPFATMGEVSAVDNTPHVMGSVAPPAYTAPPVQPTSDTPHVVPPTSPATTAPKHDHPVRMGKPMMGLRAR